MTADAMPKPVNGMRAGNADRRTGDQVGERHSAAGLYILWSLETFAKILRCELHRTDG